MSNFFHFFIAIVLKYSYTAQHQIWIMLQDDTNNKHLIFNKLILRLTQTQHSQQYEYSSLGILERKIMVLWQ